MGNWGYNLPYEHRSHFTPFVTGRGAPCRGVAGLSLLSEFWRYGKNMAKQQTVVMDGDG